MRTAPDFSSRIPELDGLRGVAIALVVAFHYANSAVETGAPRLANVLVALTGLGWSGVDLFFVLSGFLIGGILLDAKGSRNYFRAFYARRALRILPLYLAVAAAAALIGRFDRYEALLEPKLPWLTWFTFTQNFWIGAHMHSLTGAMVGTWSLAVEEQFYLAIPVLIYFFKREHFAWVIGAGIVAAPVIRAALFLHNPELATANYVLLPCRMDALLMGVAAAYVVRQGQAWNWLVANRKTLWTAVEVLTAVCAIFLVKRIHGNEETLATQVLQLDCLDLLYAGLLLLSMLDEKLKTLMKTAWLRGLGSIAYGVYLLHVVIFGLVAFSLPATSYRGVIAAVTSLAATILIAKSSWEYFEKPLVRASHRITYQ